ncbi:MAG: DivIVA domain-containing protein [Ruminococcaceae bacterium]|nr:DivIVA domain-containing protein [Oscillospiraceae bacterium]
MLTPQEVSSHAFPKAVMGGYNMSSVDEFLDELTDDYSALYKENAALKAKLKVLVEKVEDYRATEDSMRATLLTAQKMADSIVREAETKRDMILARADLDVQDRITELKAVMEANEKRMQIGQQELAGFIAAVRDVCQREMDALERLPELPVDIKRVEPVTVTLPEDAVEKEAAVLAELAELTETAENVAEHEDVKLDLGEEKEETEEDTKVYPEGNPFVPEGDPRSTRRIDLTELKFGRNYGKD